jgi:putative FmdB family regulatory protein
MAGSSKDQAPSSREFSYLNYKSFHRILLGGISLELGVWILELGNALAKAGRALPYSHVSKMPTYEYACTNCGHQFEQFQSMRDEPLKKCPKCGKPKLKRLVGGGAGLIFKGTGFYITDYKNKSGGKSEGGGESKSTPAKSGESKPASDSKSSGSTGSSSSSTSSSSPSKPSGPAKK